MTTLLVSLQTSKHYARIVLGIKSLIAAIALSCLLLIMVKKVGLPFDLNQLYHTIVQKEYDISDTSATDPESASSLVLDTKQAFTGQLDQQVMLLVDHNDKQVHGVGDDFDESIARKQRQKLCQVYQKYCDIITRDGSFTEREKYIYTLLSSFFMDRVDSTLHLEGKKLTDGFHSLVLRSNLSDDKSLGECYTTRRGCADHHEVIINLELVKSFYGFSNVLVHEMGHIVDLGVIEGKANALDKTFTEFGKPAFSIDDISLVFYNLSFQGENVRKRWAEKTDFCSLYGMTNMFEDFAECFNLYKNHNAYFKILAQTSRVLRKKYQYISNIFDGKYIFSDTVWATKASKSPNKRVRDTTKKIK